MRRVRYWPAGGGRQRAPVRRDQVDRRDGGGFADHVGHAERPEPGPRRRGLRGRGGSAVRDELPERLLPAGAERRDPQRGAELGRVPSGQVEQRVGVGHGQRVRTGAGLDDRVPGLDVPLGDHPHVEARPVVADQERGQFGLTGPQAHPVAGDARLRDLELGLADAVAVADADLVVGQTVDGEVLPELAVGEVVAAEVLLASGGRSRSGRRTRPVARRRARPCRPGRRRRC